MSDPNIFKTSPREVHLNFITLMNHTFDREDNRNQGLSIKLKLNC